MSNILVTGAFGQIGSELTSALRRRYGGERVIATGRHLSDGAGASAEEGTAAELDVTDGRAVFEFIERREVSVIYHLAAILSARGETHPAATWTVNIDGLRNVLEAARRCACRVFWPSSIAAFGPDTPRDRTPQDTIMRPTTVYGVTKVAGELLCDYYANHHDLDVRGVRYPGIISSESPPGGGTTDYAVEIFHAALEKGRYTAFVREDCVLPMMYMPDCLRAAMMLMDADRSGLEHHNGFNVAAMSFSAGELAAEVEKHVPAFHCDYAPDGRQRIADSWPRSIDDRVARKEWGWSHEYDLERTAADMIERLRRRLNETQRGEQSNVEPG